MKKLLTPVTLMAAVALTGCANPEPPRMERVLLESQVRVYTDRVLAEYRRDPDLTIRLLAENPDRTDGMYGPRPFRSAVEEDGRNLCSHMIAGVPVEQAYSAAYPKGQATGRTATASGIAADVLCPLVPR
jgi:hypothetical protein